MIKHRLCIATLFMVLLCQGCHQPVEWIIFNATGGVLRVEVSDGEGHRWQAELLSREQFVGNTDMLLGSAVAISAANTQSKTSIKVETLKQLESNLVVVDRNLSVTYGSKKVVPSLTQVK